LPEAKTGQPKLFDALTSKGTAFSRAERRKFGLLGLLPTAEKTLAERVEHCWCEFSTRRDDLENYIYLRALHDRPTLPKLRSQQFARASMNHSDRRFRCWRPVLLPHNDQRMRPDRVSRSQTTDRRRTSV
jgi:hypothetical protein